MQRLVLFLKGVCMGVADVIPGVSGGTLALILGIYRELVETIRGLNLRFAGPLLRWLRTRRQEDFQALAVEVRALNLTFLITLGAGIAFAIGAGSMVIPHLLENYPVQMRALFFGLIIASVWVPFRMLEMSSARARAMASIAGVIGFGIGFVLTDPGHRVEATISWYEMESEGTETLESFLQRAPSAWPAEQVFWSQHNETLRKAVAESDPDLFEELRTHHDSYLEAADRKVLRERSERYDVLEVPAATPVHIPRPPPWFILIAGSVAICAMILPGISGSYILLILGTYFFLLNALKGLIQFSLAGIFPANQLLYVAAFGIGAAVGILSFARVLSYLLRQYTVATLGVLVGLMLGCLRGIWPFQVTIDGVTANIWPDHFDAIVLYALITFLAGMLVVILFTWLGRRGRQKVTI